MNWHVVPYTGEYQQTLVTLIHSIQTAEFGIPITIEDQPDLMNIPEYYQCGRGNFWVAATADRQVVGTIALRDIGDRNAALRKMFVAQPWRGRAGVAQALLDSLFEWSTGQGLRDVYLGTTAAFTAAHRFYEKNGFELIEPGALPRAFPLMAVDTRFYRRSVIPASRSAPPGSAIQETRRS